MVLRNSGLVTTFTLALLASASGAAVAQTLLTSPAPVPTKARLDLRVETKPGATIYLNGTQPIAKRTANGVTSYAYKNGRPVIAMNSDGRYAVFKYENGQLDRIEEYSDGTMRRAGENLKPTIGGSIATRGGVSPMN